MDANIETSLKTMASFLNRSYNAVAIAGGDVPPATQKCLKQLPEAISSIVSMKVYEGVSSPSGTLGNTGDLYFRHD